MKNKDVVSILVDKINTEEVILKLASSNRCLEYHTGYLNALRDILKEVNHEED